MSSLSDAPRHALYFMTGGVALLLLLEVLLRFFPVEERNEWRAGGSPAQPIVIRASGGWHSSAWDFVNPVYSGVNRQGFVIPYDYRDGTPIIGIFGDSFAEGLAVTPELRMGPVLQRGLQRPVYQFASSGARAVDSLQYVRHAANVYDLQAAVVVFGEDVTVSDAPQDRFWYLDRRTGQPVFSGIGQKTLDAIVGRSALFRYVYLHLKARSQAIDFAPHLSATAFGGLFAGAGDVAGEQAADRALLAWLLDQYEPVRARGTGVCFVLNADLTSMYERGERPRLLPDAQAFKQLALARGFTVVDMGEVLAAAYARARARFDSTPYDRHWNALGHAIAARTIAERCPGVH